MSREITDTSSNYAEKDISDGEHTFKIVSIVGKQLGKAFGYVLKVEEDGRIYEQVLFPNMMGPLLRLLKCQETSPNKYEWETEQVVGETFKATITHVPDKNDATKIRQQMTDFKADESLPF